MKKLIFIIFALLLITPAVCRAEINLYGTTDQEKLAVAERFSPFYKENIDIEIINSFPQDAFQISSIRYLPNGYKEIKLRDWGYDNERGLSFEFVLNSQLCRYYFPSYSIYQCDNFSEEMITFVNSLY